MQVTNTTDFITHAVIGGGQAQEFGITNSAEFFNVLSNSLYSDKPLAVARETLCNAWDAHIEAGRTDVPVKVTVTDEFLIIEDNGPGIAPDMMGPLYATYGGTNKRTNKNVTGGFGLGCKAPFAITDHFDVESYFDGTRKIYNLSKSSAEVQGKPGIREIVSLPTDRTGVTVKIPIKPDMKHKYDLLIMRLAAAGEMKVELNGQLCKVVKFSEAKHNFVLVRNEVVDNSAHRLFIRYGNVVYPIPKENAYAAEYSNVTKFITNIPDAKHTYYTNCPWNLILQAEPDSISITPSRESISLTDVTIINIKKLLTNFLKIKNTEFTAECKRLAEESIPNTFLVSRPEKLLTNFDKYTGFFDSGTKLGYVNDLNQVAGHYTQNSYNHRNGSKEYEILARLDALIESGYGNRGRLQTFRAEIIEYQARVKAHKSYRGYRDHWKPAPWFYRRISHPILKALENLPEGGGKARLFFHGQDGARYNAPGFIELGGKKTLPLPIERCLKLLRNFVILSYNRTDVTDRAPSFPAMKNWFGHTMDSLVVIVPRRADKAKVAKEALEKLGYYVIDCTQAQKWEHEEVIIPVSRDYPKAKPKKGIPVLDQIRNKDGVVDTSLIWNEDLTRTFTPEFVVKITDRNGKATIGDTTPAFTKAVLNLFGSKGGIVVTAAQEKKYTEKGAKEFNTYLLEKTSHQIMNNKNIQNRLSSTPDYHKLWSAWEHRARSELMRLIVKSPYLASVYGLDAPLNQEEEQYLKIWDYCMGEYIIKREQLFVDTHKFIKDLAPNPNIQILKDKIDASGSKAEFLEISLMESCKDNTTHHKLISSLVKTVLEG